MKDAAMYGCIACSQPCTAASLAAKDDCKASSQIWLHEGKDGMVAIYGCLKVKTGWQPYTAA